MADFFQEEWEEHQLGEYGSRPEPGGVLARAEARVRARAAAQPRTFAKYVPHDDPAPPPLDPELALRRARDASARRYRPLHHRSAAANAAPAAPAPFAAPWLAVPARLDSREDPSDLHEALPPEVLTRSSFSAPAPPLVRRADAADAAARRRDWRLQSLAG